MACTKARAHRSVVRRSCRSQVLLAARASIRAVVMTQEQASVLSSCRMLPIPSPVLPHCRGCGSSSTRDARRFTVGDKHSGIQVGSRLCGGDLCPSHVTTVTMLPRWKELEADRQPVESQYTALCPCFAVATWTGSQCPSSALAGSR